MTKKKKVEVCEWEGELGWYETSCKHDVDTNNSLPLKELGWIVCPFCGKKIKEVS